jgi:hypothetical protein
MLNKLMSNNATGNALLIIIVVLFSSCINLKTVQDYTKSSIKTIGKYEELNYTFNSHCTDRCLFESVRKNIISRESECNCDVYQRADSVTLVLYNAINSYFSALGDLAANNVTNYNLGPLQKSLTEELIPVSGKPININKDQVASYQKIATLLLNATTNGYRKRKLRQLIEEGNEPIKILLGGFQNILSDNLAGVLNFKKERLFAFYNEIVLDNSSSIYERRKATLEYNETLEKVNSKQKQIKALSKSLKKVAEGHEKLAKSKLSVKELQQELTPVSTDIKAIIAEFNKLKTT